MKLYAAVALALVLAALLLWRPWDAGPADPADRAAPAPAAVAGPLPPDPAITAPDPAALAPSPQAGPVALTPREIQAVRDAIDNLEFVFRDFAASLGGNPVGTNAEITAALRGDNLKQLQLDLPDGSTVNPAGELCDPWGTPWFFHQLSSRKMEIRSAGRDRQLYTDDDFVR